MGKIGIILAFLLSVAAAGGSYYLYQGWVEARTVRGVVEAKYDKVKEKILSVQSEKEQVVLENEKLSARSEEFRNNAETMQVQVKKLEDEQARMDSEKIALQKKLEGDQKMIAELQAKMAELEQKAKDAQAACAVTPADMKSDPFASNTTAAASGTSPLVFKPVTSGGSAMPSSVSRSVQEVPQTSGTSSTENPVTAATSLTELTTAAATTGPKVLTVNRKFNFVVVNQGLQEGLQMGDRLIVLKQGRQCATVQVEKLYDKFSAATLVEEDPKNQVVEGDEIRKA